MKNLSFIGTLHQGYTDNDELLLEIRKFNTKVIFVEIKQEDVEKGNISKYPPEMIFVYKHAQENNIPIYGFDYHITNPTIIKTSKKEEREIELKQVKLIKSKGWKAFNDVTNCQNLTNIYTKERIQDEWDFRENKMRENIIELIRFNDLKGSNITVITGCGHIAYFKNVFPNSNFVY